MYTNELKGECHSYDERLGKMHLRVTPLVHPHRARVQVTLLLVSVSVFARVGLP